MYTAYIELHNILLDGHETIFTSHTRTSNCITRSYVKFRLEVVIPSDVT